MKQVFAEKNEIGLEFFPTELLPHLTTEELLMWLAGGKIYLALSCTNFIPPLVLADKTVVPTCDYNN